MQLAKRQPRPEAPRRRERGLEPERRIDAPVRLYAPVITWPPPPIDPGLIEGMDTPPPTAPPEAAPPPPAPPEPLTGAGGITGLQGLGIQGGVTVDACSESSHPWVRSRGQHAVRARASLRSLRFIIGPY